MFYSETLLSKTGPLARVWLSANLERKLSKTHILQSNIESSVNAIVDQGTAPMALRLSGQLLLGVVRIYSRKARYLLDDCNEALLKIKMVGSPFEVLELFTDFYQAFRPGNVDLPANLVMPSAAALTITDKISDPLLPELDPSLLDFRPMDIDFGGKKDDPLNWTSQDLSNSISIEAGRSRRNPMPDVFDDDEDAMHVELDLDFGQDEVPPAEDPSLEGPSIEIGRRERAPRLLEDDGMSETEKFQDDNLGLDFGDAEPGRARSDSAVPSLIADNPDEDRMLLDDAMDFQIPMEDPTLQLQDNDAPANPRLERDSQSPLSSVRSSIVRTFAFDEEEEDEATMQQAHKAKRRKVLQADSETTISNTQIKAQQADRSAIIRPASFLPRDPLLLSLMNMERSGGFVSSILGDGQAKGWAPELRGILSIEAVRKSGELKRKRDSGVADLDEEDLVGDKDTVPQLEIPEDDDHFGGVDEGIGAEPVRHQSGNPDSPPDDGLAPPFDEEPNPADQLNDEDQISPIRDNFDETTAPLLHPLESGPISLGTQHAVHLLRDRFGSAPKDSQLNSQSPSQLKKAQTLFQDMLPEATTTKADATKMFFEVLVLATKDAVKVEQSPKELGGPLRIRGKRGLWGAWAEREAGGEIAAQDGITA